MTEESVTSSFVRSLTRGELPIILIAAVVQGWSLYALHLSIDRSAWPATDTAWLIALYAVVVLVPLTVQMLAQHVRRPLTWMIVAALVGFYLLIGWHYGKWILDEPSAGGFELGFILSLQWLLVMPFLQARLIE